MLYETMFCLHYCTADFEASVYCHNVAVTSVHYYFMFWIVSYIEETFLGIVTKSRYRQLKCIISAYSTFPDQAL